MRFHRVPARRTVVAAAIAFVAAAGVFAAPVTAHVQVRPAEAAPGDPVLWTLLMPNERDVATVSVELAIPDGVLPFSFQPIPGWKRRVTLRANRLIRSVVWSGRLAPEEVLITQFLATTPDTEGPITWKAIQTYADGRKVRWIGGVGSEEPGSVTQVRSSVARQNAGGERGGAVSANATQNPDQAEGSDDHGLAIAALGVAVAALIAATSSLVYSRRRQ